MKILILGSTGMLGHQLVLQLSKLRQFELLSVARTHNVKIIDQYPENNYLSIPDLTENTLRRLLETHKPDFVLNCVGLVKQVEQYTIKEMIYLNATLPQILSHLAEEHLFKLIHFSTDCVFQGSKGEYLDNEPIDALDLYGRSKALGEVVNSPNTLTLRTSIIGHEIRGYKSLLEWFLRSNEKEIKGYSNAYFSGQTTNDLSKKIIGIITNGNFQHGLFNCGSTLINKYQLLLMIKDVYSVKKTLKKSNEVRINRSLNIDKFSHMFMIPPTDWRNQIEEMSSDYRNHRELYR